MKSQIIYTITVPIQFTLTFPVEEGDRLSDSKPKIDKSMENLKNFCESLTKNNNIVRLGETIVTEIKFRP